jgi:hypothetical protein
LGFRQHRRAEINPLQTGFGRKLPDDSQESPFAAAQIRYGKMILSPGKPDRHLGELRQHGAPAVVRINMRAPGRVVRRPPAKAVGVVFRRYVAGREKDSAARSFI